MFRLMFCTPQPQLNSLQGWNFLVLMAVTVIGWVTLQNCLLRSNYHKGFQAYEAGNCAVAISYFDLVIDEEQLSDTNDYVVRAQAKKAECEAFQSAVNRQKVGKHEAALVAYDDFVSYYRSSALVQPIRQQTAVLFNQAELTVLATPTVCERVDSLVKNQLIPQLDTNLPSLYRSCGQLYTAEKYHINTIAMYSSK